MPIEAKSVTPLIQIFDMPTSLAFYRDILGFKVVQDSGQGEQSGWVWLRLGGADVMLNTQYDEGERPDAPDEDGIEWHKDTTLYIECSNVDAAYTHLKDRLPNVAPPTTAPYGMKQLTVHDPDGYALCFQWSAN